MIELFTSIAQIVIAMSVMYFYWGIHKKLEKLKENDTVLTGSMYMAIKHLTELEKNNERINAQIDWMVNQLRVMAENQRSIPPEEDKNDRKLPEKTLRAADSKKKKGYQRSEEQRKAASERKKAYWERYRAEKEKGAKE